MIFGRCGCFSYQSFNLSTSLRSNCGNFLYCSSQLASWNDDIFGNSFLFCKLQTNQKALGQWRVSGIPKKKISQIQRKIANCTWFQLELNYSAQLRLFSSTNTCWMNWSNPTIQRSSRQSLVEWIEPVRCHSIVCFFFFVFYYNFVICIWKRAINVQWMAMDYC